MTTAHSLIRHDSLWQLLSTMPGTDFGGHPACADEDPELFFPLPGQVAKENAAKAVCSSCPLQTACLTYALNHGVEGVWGATTEQERRNARQRSGKAVA